MFEKFKEFRKEFSERVRSPFVSALIISWSIYHWKIFYLMFYNSESILLGERISNIEYYLCCHSCYQLIWRPIFTAFIALLFLNIFKSFGLAIKLLYENWASPYIQKWLYNSNIIEKTIYEKTLRAYNRVKEELREKEEKYRENNDALSNITSNFQNYQYNSIPTRHINTNDLFNPEYYWINKFVWPKTGNSEEIKFNVDFNSIHLEKGEKVEIRNIKVSEDGFIYIFEKQFQDSRILQNIVVKDKLGNYHGLEAGEIIISYIKEDEVPKQRTKKIPNS